MTTWGHGTASGRRAPSAATGAWRVLGALARWRYAAAGRLAQGRAGLARVEPVFGVTIRAMALWVRARFDLRVRGLEHLPAQGPVIVAPNHVSQEDPVVVGVVGHRGGRRLRAVAIAEVFELPFVGWLLHRCGQIPIDRERSRAALVAARRALRAGEALLLYPEGGIVRGREATARTGVGRLALDGDVPVVPVTSAGLEPRRSGQRLRRRAAVVVGPPVDLARARQLPGREAGRAAADAVMAAIREQLPEARRLAAE